MSPGSSDVEHPVLNGKVAGSSPAPGFLYIVLRKEMTGGALLAQCSHAASECIRPEDAPLPINTRACVLQATKDELARLRFDLEEADIHHAAILETDGPLAGCITAIGIYARDRDELRARVPMLTAMKVWR